MKDEDDFDPNVDYFIRGVVVCILFLILTGAGLYCLESLIEGM